MNIVDDDSTRTIGRRLREVRFWRRKSLRTVAELAGLSESHLSRLERGERPVDRRSTLEALAAALDVAPGELTGSHELAAGEGISEVHAAVVALRVALADNSLDDPADETARPWSELAADLHRINNDLRPRADYAALGLVLPDLIADLHATAAADPSHRGEALLGLLDVYTAATATAKHLGEPDLAAVAAMHARGVAAELDFPIAHSALAELLRAQAVSSPARERSLSLAARAADRTAHAVGTDGAAAEMYGMLHLTCALNAAALTRYSESADHQTEAAEVAARVGDGSNFGNQNFGQTNLGFWRITLAVERGEGGKVAEIARHVDPTAVVSAARRSGFYTDLGRGLATERGRRGDAVAALRTAEQLAPQRVRANPYVRETVTDLLRQARRDSEGRELRGLAYRMGVGVR